MSSWLLCYDGTMSSNWLCLYIANRTKKLNILACIMLLQLLYCDVKLLAMYTIAYGGS